MKRLFVIIFFCNLFTNIYSQNYLPLNVSNKWQYLISGYGNEGSAYALYTFSVTDTLIENKTYYKFSNSNDFIRYSKSDQKVYLFYNDSEYVYVDFTVPIDSFYLAFGPWHQYGNILSVGGIDTIFNAVRLYGGYERKNLPIIEEIIFSDSIGITSKDTQDEFGFHNEMLIESIILDSMNNVSEFTNHFKPQFEIVPINQASSIDFVLNCKVKHNYNRLYGNPPWSTINFIDTVKMFSYYSKGDSAGLITSSIPYHDYSLANPNDDYLFEIQLDTSLLKKGHIFNYKIYSIDKGIIPEQSYAPDSGYYKCIWAEPNDIEIGGYQLNNFRLSQNYPNPFNPSTTIEYQIPQSSFVTLKVYDALGKEVVTLVNEEKPSGIYEVNFEPKELTSGLYLYKISAGSFEQTRKMLLLK